jgi:hypothetical protein
MTKKTSPNTARRYWTLLVRDNESAPWRPEFGAYSLHDVLDERREYRDHGVAARNLKYISTADTQAAIDSALAELNGPVAGQSYAIDPEPVAETAPQFDPQDPFYLECHGYDLDGNPVAETAPEPADGCESVEYSRQFEPAEKSPMIIGTNNFVSRQRAYIYYRDYGYHISDIDQKIRDGEIAIGAPDLKPGQRLFIIDNGTRYAIEE